MAKKVLIVDDSALVRKQLTEMIETLGFEIDTAKNGQEAVDKATAIQYNVITMDINMPIMDGIEMIKYIRKNDSSIPIVLLTAHNREEYLMKLINLHVQHFILKPINSKNLEEGIANALQGRHTGNLKLSQNVFLDIDNLSLHIEDKTIALSKREMSFLILLSENRLIRYDEIEIELWSEKVMSLDALKSFVRDLRKKLPYEMIENIPQVGYKLLHN